MGRAVVLLTFIGADTLSLQTIPAAQPAPLFVAETRLAITAARRKSSPGCRGAAAILIDATWLVSQETVLAEFRMMIGHGRKLAPVGDSLDGGANLPTLSLAETDDSE